MKLLFVHSIENKPMDCCLACILPAAISDSFRRYKVCQKCNSIFVAATLHTEGSVKYCNGALPRCRGCGGANNVCMASETPTRLIPNFCLAAPFVLQTGANT